MIAGHGVARSGSAAALTHFAQRYRIPVATTFMGKGVISDEDPLALGVVGLMQHDYENFAFDEADVILSVGYELQEFDPVRIDPTGDKIISDIITAAADVDAHFDAP